MTRQLNREERERLTALSNQTKVCSIDDFMKLGRYCCLVLVAAEFMTLTSLAQMVYMVYAGISPTVTAISGVNTTHLSTKEACKIYDFHVDSNSSNALDIEYEFYSVNVEFNKICSKGRQVKLSTSVQMIGVLIGALVAGPYSDYYGRKKTIIISLLGMAIFSFAVAYANDLATFTQLRFLVGLFTGGLTSVQGVYLIENLPKKHRLWINTVITWSPNFIIFPIIVYFCQDWRNLSTFCGVISLITVASMWILEESPRWRINHGDIDGARKSLDRICKIDGNWNQDEEQLVEKMLEHEKQLHDSKQSIKLQRQIVLLLKSGKYMVWTTTICYGIIVTSLINYGLLFNMEKLSGSLYWNNVIFGIIRWIMNISSGIADYFFDCVGRREINTSAMLYIVPSLAAIIAVNQSSYYDSLSWIARFSTIGIAAMTSQLYLAKFIIASELFPTSVRNIAISLLSVCSRVATIMAPLLFNLADIWPMLPYLVLLVFSAIDTVVFCEFLPETKGKDLVNRLPEKTILSRRTSIVEA